LFINNGFAKGTRKKLFRGKIRPYVFSCSPEKCMVEPFKRAGYHKTSFGRCFVVILKGVWKLALW